MTLYFDPAWAALSTIGVANVLYGFIVMSITRFSPIILVPIVSSVACAVANGLCFYAFYNDNPIVDVAVASGFADMFWLIQEAGILFYSYAILNSLLIRRSRTVFMILFWTMILGICIIRMFILVGRIEIVTTSNSDYQKFVNYLHVGYFILIASLECVSAFFLLREFAATRKASRDAALSGGLLNHLMRGTETRVASLALIGIARAITQVFCNAIPPGQSTAGQVDLFIYTLECLFPMMFYIDILACRIKFANQCSLEMPHIRSPKSGGAVWDGSEVLSHHVSIRTCSNSSLAERQLIVKPPSSTADLLAEHGVVKTVEFMIFDEAASDSLGISHERTRSLPK
ncbi:hypothetical protein AB5N19_02151 [Seiridium cardinale]